CWPSPCSRSARHNCSPCRCATSPGQSARLPSPCCCSAAAAFSRSSWCATSGAASPPTRSPHGLPPLTGSRPPRWRPWPATLAGAVPSISFALVIRALVCKPIAFLAAGRFLALRPDDQLAWRSMLGAAPGLVAASVTMGLALGRGLWSWLERVRAAEEESESFLTATVRGDSPWWIVLRQGVWLRRRRELGALLLG